MQCPNCNMNVSDNAKMCLHCGCSFEQPVAPQPVQNNVVGQNNPQQPVNQTQQEVPTQTAEEKASEKREYLIAYYGENRYKKIQNASFSVGNFFLGFVWLLHERLYKPALSEAIKTLVPIIITTFIYFWVLLTDNPFYLGAIAEFITFIIVVAVTYSYSRDFSDYSLEKAHKVIDEISAKTDNKDERITLLKKAYKKNYFAFLLIPVIIAGFGLIAFLMFKAIVNKSLTTEEFEKEAKTYFQSAALLAESGVLEYDGKEPNPQEFYYVLIDEDIKDNEHPLTTETNKDRGKFDGKGYVIIIMGNSSLTTHGFVCLNNGDSTKRYTSIETLNVYESISGDKNSFDTLKIDKKGKCDISELVGHMNYPLNQLTKKAEDKKS